MKKIFTLILIFSLLSNLYANMDREKKNGQETITQGLKNIFQKKKLF
ncbi:hypothetical protein [Borreliella garinii]|nr:hypothetical protein [Borreliella garinii]ACL35029.1 hypothetical protein BGAFAR04_F0004 [Borreliella garinii Far04]WNZ67113.1 hypothetical protein PT139_04580 [Borreliella garinii]WNZ68111.1 hypothetical protein PT135_04580 [Borreliella garinii]WNZ69108.1 hypothetical protein PT138_04580 [Borreliella garinii]WNZ70110.1 hypothetical protein PT140_04570 [Borreliella garinii]